MFKNYLKTTLRNLARNKSYTIINAAGLTLGIVCALIIFSIISFEYSFDNYHSDGERIYRVVRIVNEFGVIEHSSGLPYPLPAALRSDFPEIEALTIVDCNFGARDIAVKREDGSIARFKEEKGIAHVEPDYFRIFHYEWLLGNPASALQDPRSVVISQELAQKYFGAENPIGKSITYDNLHELQVTGIVKPVPKNTDLPFNMLVAYDPKTDGSENWGSISTSVQCYLKLPARVAPGQLEKRFDDFIVKHRNKEAAELTDYRLQPLNELHFDTRYQNFGSRTVSKTALLALGLIGAALLLAACINFVNLNTALALRRAKEVGVRKVLGSTQSRLVVQFLGETALLSLVAIFLSLAVAEIASGHLTFILGYRLELNLFGDATIALYLAALFVAVTLAAGFYPAVYLSRFSPINALRQKNATRYREGLPLRRGLVVVQFAISQALILCTVIIGSQMHYLRHADMGFNKEAIVEVSLPQNDDDKLTRLKTLLLQHPAVTRVSFSNTGAASGNSWSGNYKLTIGSEVKEANAQVKFVDEDFFETYELQLLAGADHARTDSVWQYLVNEAFVSEAGFAGKENELLGKPVQIWGRKGHVNGIVKNFNTKSLHNEMTPVMMLVQNRYGQAGIKIDMRQTKAALSAIEAAWSVVYPENVFDYGFLDENIAEFYEGEEKTAALINTFAVIAIVIGCMGLLGLVSYMATQRTKEIGIRKVLGATVANVTALLSKDFVTLVLLANLVAWPMAYLAMNKWLQNFAYRIDIGWPVFALAGGLALIIALLTVSAQAIKAALANPVESLRYE